MAVVSVAAGWDSSRWSMMVVVVVRNYPWLLMTAVVKAIQGGSGSEVPVTVDGSSG